MRTCSSGRGSRARSSTSRVSVSPGDSERPSARSSTRRARRHPGAPARRSSRARSSARSVPRRRAWSAVTTASRRGRVDAQSSTVRGTDVASSPPTRTTCSGGSSAQWWTQVRLFREPRPGGETTCGAAGRCSRSRPWSRAAEECPNTGALAARRARAACICRSRPSAPRSRHQDGVAYTPCRIRRRSPRRTARVTVDGERPRSCSASRVRSRPGSVVMGSGSPRRGPPVRGPARHGDGAREGDA